MDALNALMFAHMSKIHTAPRGHNFVFEIPR